MQQVGRPDRTGTLRIKLDMFVTGQNQNFDLHALVNVWRVLAICWVCTGWRLLSFSAMLRADLDEET